MRKQLYSIGAILLSTAIFIAGNGLLGTLIPVRAHLAGFSNLSIGIIGSAYFAGFVLGCYAGPRLLARAGHSRTFAVGAGIAAATTLLQSMFVTEIMWTLMRVAFGFAAASLYMVIESWLNDRATNETRGRILSAYLTVNFASLIVGQYLFSTSRPGGFTLFSLSAIFYALCLIPVGLTRLPQPHAHVIPNPRPLRLFRISPVGVAGCIAVGLSNSAVWTLAPIYAQNHGLTKTLLAVFMGAFTLGGALSQVPLGRLSDRMDRRFVIAAISVASAALGVTLYLFGRGERSELLLLIGLFGATALPFYGLSLAHANDRFRRKSFVEASATLLLINSLAACFGPTIAALVMNEFGTGSLFLYTAAIHTGMALFTILRLRMKVAPLIGQREKFEPVPQQGSQAALELDPRASEEVRVKIRP